MSAARRVYLDNAATSWPKPEAVYRAVEAALRELGAPAGRGVYAEASEVERRVDQARAALARLLGAGDPRRVIFTANGTDALNLALHGLLRSGDHVVTTVAEHNSVLRPLRALQATRGVQVTRVGCDGQGLVDPAEVRAALRRPTRLVALVHVSNVTGAIQPAGEIAQLAHTHGALLLLDAAQSLGHLPWTLADVPADLVAAPGHKGLLGPLGTGLLYVAPGVEDRLDSIRQGGTGSRSDQDIQPDFLPDKYEAGNLNVPGILGLGAGAAWVFDRGTDALRAHEAALATRLVAGLGALDGAVVHGPRDPARRAGVVSVTLAGYDPQEAAAALDTACRVQVRAGLHCAPRMHQALGTLPGGTVRFSVGPLNTSEDVDAAIAGVEGLTAAS